MFRHIYDTGKLKMDAFRMKRQKSGEKQQQKPNIFIQCYAFFWLNSKISGKKKWNAKYGQLNRISVSINMKYEQECFE